ncbi:MAG: protein-L-isoaspartate O-methyltransferase family protein [Xanthobacteraceae bacterium]
MPDFTTARRMMVDGQVRTSDVTDLRLIAAMLELPRERFVPRDKVALAYLDRDLPVTEGTARPQRCLLKPMVLAKLIQAAEIGAGSRVLDVGTATGYSAAVMAQLAGSVVALEQDEDLARHARDNLAGVGNVEVVTGSLTAGWPAGAFYDAILLNGATEHAPETLLRQLRDGGRLVCVLGRPPASKAVLYRSTGGQVSARPIFDAAAPVLPGFAAKPAFVF